MYSVEYLYMYAYIYIHTHTFSKFVTHPHLYMRVNTVPLETGPLELESERLLLLIIIAFQAQVLFTSWQTPSDLWNGRGENET